MLHRCAPEWPCLSFDILLDERRDVEHMSQKLGIMAPEYPMTTYLVSGS